MRGKSNPRRSRREEAQTSPRPERGQRLVTSSPTLCEEAPPYRVQRGAGVTPTGAGGVPAARSETPGEDARRTRRPEACATPFRFIDLFCGIGGFRLAFERAGARCVFSSDWDRFSQQTYAANFGEVPHGDIHQVAVADIPAHDILCGCFPCQTIITHRQ